MIVFSELFLFYFIKNNFRSKKNILYLCYEGRNRKYLSINEILLCQEKSKNCSEKIIINLLSNFCTGVNTFITHCNHTVYISL